MPHNTSSSQSSGNNTPSSNSSGGRPSVTSSKGVVVHNHGSGVRHGPSEPSSRDAFSAQQQQYTLTILTDSPAHSKLAGQKHIND
ncbi:hypothetical protein KCU71_g11046, partial [Aureobasidium melanogenum]